MYFLIALNTRTGWLLTIYSRDRETQLHTQRTQYVHSMLNYCWASVVDGGPNRHWVNDLCLVGMPHSTGEADPALV